MSLGIFHQDDSKQQTWQSCTWLWTFAEIVSLEFICFSKCDPCWQVNESTEPESIWNSKLINIAEYDDLNNDENYREQ